MTLDDNDDDCSSDLVECAVFTQKDLAAVALPVMEDIRRCGRLCDVTIKVRENATRAVYIFLLKTFIGITHPFMNHVMS